MFIYPKNGNSYAIKLRDMDWDGLDDISLLNVTVDTDMNFEIYNDPGFTNNRVFIGKDYLAFDWRWLYFRPGSYFNVSLQPTPIPVPHSFTLLGIGLAILFFTRWRKISPMFLLGL